MDVGFKDSPERGRNILRHLLIPYSSLGPQTGDGDQRRWISVGYTQLEFSNGSRRVGPTECVMEGQTSLVVAGFPPVLLSLFPD